MHIQKFTLIRLIEHYQSSLVDVRTWYFRSYFILIGTAFTILSASCSKIECNQTPHASSPYSQGMYATVDGCSVRDCFPGLIYSSLGASVSQNNMFVSARFYCFEDPEDDFSISLYISNPMAGEDYILEESTTGNYAILRYPHSEREFITSSQEQGWVTLSEFDPESGVLNGTFEFDCIESSEEIVLAVTDGVLQNISFNPF